MFYRRSTNRVEPWKQQNLTWNIIPSRCPTAPTCNQNRKSHPAQCCHVMNHHYLWDEPRKHLWTGHHSIIWPKYHTPYVLIILLTAKGAFREDHVDNEASIASTSARLSHTITPVFNSRLFPSSSINLIHQFHRACLHSASSKSYHTASIHLSKTNCTTLRQHLGPGYIHQLPIWILLETPIVVDGPMVARPRTTGEEEEEEVVDSIIATQLQNLERCQLFRRWLLVHQFR